jgi:hypothetical protein
VDAVTYVSLTDEVLGLSLEAPAGWYRGSSEIFPLVLRAPEDGGYRASCNFSLERFDPPTPEGLETFARRSKRAQLEDYEGFTELGAEELVVDNRPGLLQRYRWSPEALGRTMEQLLVLVVVQPGLLLQADAASLAERSEYYMPVFGRIVSSVRFLG